MHKDWEPIIGLEIHARLNTQSKLFSSAPNCLTDSPNTNISAVCVGLPGALPVLNLEAVKKAVQFGLAIGGNIALLSTFDRKSYFYPDCPRNFQITQYKSPLIQGGNISGFPILEAHLEDDSATLNHFDSSTLIDFNRAGAPILEIVTGPNIQSAEDAKLIVSRIKEILLSLKASDGDLRVDANVSVREKEEKKLRPCIEIKNLSSLSSMQHAIDYEINRQINLYEKNPSKSLPDLIEVGTYRWDESKKRSFFMRKKSTPDDYRYFPEPDLPPLVLTEVFISEVRKTIPINLLN